MNVENLGVMSEYDGIKYTGWYLCYFIFSALILEPLRLSALVTKDNENEIEPQVFFIVEVYLTRVFLEK